MADLAAWRESPYRKPLVLLGARQVGKTYILQEFGARYYTNVVYVNCEQNSRVASIFADDLEPREIVRNIGALTFQSISRVIRFLFWMRCRKPRALLRH